MRVRFWGVRGSIATPGPATLRYGGNTSCVSMTADDGGLFVFDCGTGARGLAQQWGGGAPRHVSLFIGHTHGDHIQGLPFFLPAFGAGSEITIYGPAGIDRSLSDALRSQMDYAFFPVPLTSLAARVEFVELGEGAFTIGDVQIQTRFLNHTAPCLAYRLTSAGRCMVYATDHEMHATAIWRPDRPAGVFEPAALLHPGDIRHAEFLRDADLVIHDAQYTTAEYATKVGWGHSSVEYAVAVALAARAKWLALFHHDPDRGDAALDALLVATRQQIAASAAALEVVASAEGVELWLDGEAGGAMAERQPPAPSVPLGARVLVADDDDLVALLLQTALLADGYAVIRAHTGAEAVRLARAEPFDLILLDLEMPELNGFGACTALRADRRLAGVPIVILTGHTGEEDILRAFDAGATDYITKPFALSLVRARVRSWLARATTR